MANVKKVFISHWSEERELAEYIKTYIDEFKIPNLDVFCYERNLYAGKSGKLQIKEHAVNSQIILLLLSPFSLNNKWIQFEAGLVNGANPENILIPFLFGGAKINHLPDTISEIWALEKGDSTRFELSFNKHMLGDPGSKADYSKFTSEMPQIVTRIFEYGSYGKFSPNAELVTIAENWVLNNDNPKIDVPKTHAGSKELVSIRVTFSARRACDRIHWKTGIKFKKSADVRFVFHSGTHSGYSSWTVYPNYSDGYHYDIPTHLDVEEPIEMEIFMKKGSNDLVCIGKGTNGRKQVLYNDKNKETWSLVNADWDSVEICGWCDSTEPKFKDQKFCSIIEKLEAEYE